MEPHTLSRLIDMRGAPMPLGSIPDNISNVFHNGVGYYTEVHLKRSFNFFSNR